MTDQAPSILLVDDDEDICENMADIFTDLGYDVDVAHEGRTALELVRGRPYDVALLDLKMPGMDGVTLYREIKKVQAGMVAFLVTAYAGASTAEEAVAAGMWQVLPKPVDLPRLLRLIAEVLERPLVLVVDDDEDLCAQPLGPAARTRLQGLHRPRWAAGGRAAAEFDPGRPDRPEAPGPGRRRGVPAGPGGEPGGAGRAHHRIPGRDGADGRAAPGRGGRRRTATSHSTSPSSWGPWSNWPKDEASGLTVRDRSGSEPTCWAATLSILIVEDDADTRDNLRDILELDGLPHR